MAIWFQGCTLNCKGCCNPELHDIKANHILSLEELVLIAKKSKQENGIEGITYLGGEPTLQRHLDVLSNEFHNLNLGVILFTGYKIEQLAESLVTSVDLIIDGQFIEKEIDQNRNLVGSKNQTLKHISNRYIKSMGWFMNKRDLHVDMHISRDLLITGDVLTK
jgi:anaerobic ribonucleoside-triphosphate reductase activating protein